MALQLVEQADQPLEEEVFFCTTNLTGWLNLVPGRSRSSSGDCQLVRHLAQGSRGSLAAPVHGHHDHQKKTPERRSSPTHQKFDRGRSRAVRLKAWLLTFSWMDISTDNTDLRPGKTLPHSPIRNATFLPAEDDLQAHFSVLRKSLTLSFVAWTRRERWKVIPSFSTVHGLSVFRSVTC